MCQAGLNTADLKLAIHQLTEHAKLLKNNSEQWVRLAGSSHGVAEKLQEAAAKAAEASALLEAALGSLHDHSHSHVHISEV